MRRVVAKVESATAKVTDRVSENVESVFMGVQSIIQQAIVEHEENKRIAAERMARIAELRERLHDYASDIEILRREIDPKIEVGEIADEIAARLQTKTPFGNPPVDNTHGRPPSATSMSDAEIEAKLGSRYEALDRVVSYLCSECGQTPAVRRRIAVSWSRLPPKSEQATKQPDAYDCVTAFALLVGEDDLPDTKTVGGWFDDPTHRRVMLGIYEKIAGHQHDYLSADTDEHRRRERDSFLKAYRLALKSVMKTEEDETDVAVG